MTKRVEQSKEVFQTLFGNLPDPDGESDHEFMEILRGFIFGDVFHCASLDYRIRELVTITCLASIQTLPQLAAHIHACLNINVNPIEIREAMYQLAPFIGFPKALNAIATMNEVFQKRDINIKAELMATVTDEIRYEKGHSIQYPLYGDEIKNKYPDIPSLPKFLTEFCFGDFYTRKGMDLPMRELLVLVILTALGAVNQIKAHVIGNLKAGNTKETLYAVLMQCLPYIGFPQVFNVLNVIKETAEVNTKESEDKL